MDLIVTAAPNDAKEGTGAKVANVGTLRLLAHRVGAKLNMVENLQGLHYHAEQVHRDLLEVANTRVQRSNLFETIVMLGIVVAQVFVVRRWFSGATRRDYGSRGMRDGGAGLPGAFMGV